MFDRWGVAGPIEGHQLGACDTEGQLAGVRIRDGWVISVVHDQTRLIDPWECSGGVGLDAPIDLSLRIGVHIGDVVHADDDLLGNAVNKAARIASSADGGQIVVSRVVHAMLGESPEFTLGDTIEADLKGLPGLHEIKPLNWVN